MRIASINGRATLITESGQDLQGVDIEKWTDGKFPSNTRELLPHLNELTSA
jgi:hypothetical protein